MQKIPTWIVVGLASAGCVLAFASCATNDSDSAGAESAAVTGDAKIAAGRKIYLGRCTACHSPEPVRDYTLAEWRELLPDMSADANLSIVQEEHLMAYIESHF